MGWIAISFVVWIALRGKLQIYANFAIPQTQEKK